jgi:hypothetical protein
MSILKKLLVAGVIAAFLVAGFGVAAQSAPAIPRGKLISYSGYPTFSIVSVEEDERVTVKTNNLPANDTFDVTMGPMGTRGVGGVKVDKLDSGDGGVQTLTFNIPSSLAGSYQISIRMESPTSGYYAFNWFYNNSGGGAAEDPDVTPPPGYSGYPTFSIVSVDEDGSVTIKTHNLPPEDNFRVTMGPMGSKGIGGTVVDMVDSGTGGTKTYTFDIPAALHGSYRIAIRMQSPTSGYYAYNWFYNNTTNGATEPTDETPTATPDPGYTGFPSFKILAVVRDTSVKVETTNLPPEDGFVVTMGPMGTKGVGGIKVDTVDSGSGGTKQLSFDIPAELKGSYRIAIRMQSPTSGYFAYNWFYNNNAGTP